LRNAPHIVRRVFFCALAKLAAGGQDLPLM